MGGEYRGGKHDEQDAKWARLAGMTLHTPSFDNPKPGKRALALLTM
jgi:hypothetical protein